MASYGSIAGTSSGLAATGVAVELGGHLFGVLAIVMTALLMVTLGALTLRLGWRRDRALNER